MTVQNLSRILSLNGIAVSDDTAEALTRLSALLVDYNSRVNLTSVTDDNAIAVRHFADSLKILPYLPEGARIIDVGAGGGFPSLPIAIARPDVKVTALDSTKKKLDFIEYAAKALGLRGISTLNARAEDAARDINYRQRFDIATARVVARLNILCELCMPFVSPDVKNGGAGKFIAYKGADYSAEVDESAAAAEKTGGKAAEIAPYVLLGEPEEQKRALIFIQKARSTPQSYPRRYAQITKSPL